MNPGATPSLIPNTIAKSRESAPFADLTLSRASSEHKAGGLASTFSFDEKQVSSPGVSTPRTMALDFPLSVGSMGLSPSNTFSLFSNIGRGLAETESEEYEDEQEFERTQVEATVPKIAVQGQSTTSQQETKETKTLIISDFGDRFPAVQKLTPQEEAWAVACLVGVHAAFKDGNMTALKFFLGPDLYPLRREYNQLLRNSRLKWLEPNCCLAFCVGSQEVAKRFEEKLYFDAVIKTYQKEMIDRTRRMIPSPGLRTPADLLTERDLVADEQFIQQYEAICKIYAERGLTAYHIQLRPLKKQLEKFAQHIWVQDT